MRAEVGEYQLVGVAGGGCFSVPAQQASLWKRQLNQRFQALGANTHLANLFTAAVRAFGRHAARVAANVAE